MIVAGHQPNYLPYCGFFHKLALCDVFAIVDTPQFVKRGPFGWQHRNKIRTKDGWMWLTVPVLTKGKYHQRICDTEINNNIDWRRKHWRSICLNYKSAPYFAGHSDFFEALYRKNWTSLADLNTEIILYMAKALKISTKIVKCSELDIDGRGSDLLINICRKLGAAEYLSGIHGRDYIDMDAINRSGIKVVFQDFKHPVYGQGYGDFIPNLSAIDLLFRRGDEAAELISNKEEAAAQYVE